MLRVQITSKVQLPRNPLPVLWINSHWERYTKSLVSGSRWLLSRTTYKARSQESGFAVLQIEVAVPFTDYLGMLPLLQPEMLKNQQGRKMYWGTTRCIFFFLLPSFLPLPLRFIQASVNLPWLYFSWSDGITIPQWEWIAASYLPSCLCLLSALRVTWSKCADGKRRAFPDPGSRRSYNAIHSHGTFCRPFPKYFACRPTLPLTLKNIVNLF